MARALVKTIGEKDVITSVDALARVPVSPTLNNWATVPVWKLSLTEPGQYDLSLSALAQGKVNTSIGLIAVAFSTSEDPADAFVGFNIGYCDTTDVVGSRGFTVHYKGLEIEEPTDIWICLKIQNISSATSITNLSLRNDLGGSLFQARKIG